MKSICLIGNSREKASSENTVWNRNAAHPEGPTLPRLSTRESQYMSSSERLFKPGWDGISVTCKRKSSVWHCLIFGVKFKHTGGCPLLGLWALHKKQIHSMESSDKLLLMSEAYWPPVLLFNTPPYWSLKFKFYILFKGAFNILKWFSLPKQPPTSYCLFFLPTHTMTWL